VIYVIRLYEKFDLTNDTEYERQIKGFKCLLRIRLWVVEALKQLERVVEK